MFENLKTVEQWRGLLNDKGTGVSLSQIYLRENWIRSHTFPIITVETVKALTGVLCESNVLEVGCGTGFLAKCLAENGIKITAVDNYSERYVAGTLFRNNPIVTSGNALDFIKPEFDVVLMSWPDYKSDFAFDIAFKMLPGKRLIYQGEGHYGCTGNDEFHEYLETHFDYLEDLSYDLNKDHLKFPSIHDSWYVYEKKWMLADD